MKFINVLNVVELKHGNKKAVTMDDFPKISIKNNYNKGECCCGAFTRN